jgi:hypothetical protein
MRIKPIFTEASKPPFAMPQIKRVKPGPKPHTSDIERFVQYDLIAKDMINKGLTVNQAAYAIATEQFPEKNDKTNALYCKLKRRYITIFN